MGQLKFYEKEKEMFPQSYSIHVTNEEARKIVKKLLRHFKIGSTWYRKHFVIKFYGTKTGGGASTSSFQDFDIRLPHNPSIGMIIHEVAHKYMQRKIGREKGEKSHTKKLMTIITKMQRYARKKNYWQHIIKGEIA